MIGPQPGARPFLCCKAALRADEGRPHRQTVGRLRAGRTFTGLGGERRLPRRRKPAVIAPDQDDIAQESKTVRANCCLRPGMMRTPARNAEAMPSS